MKETCYTLAALTLLAIGSARLYYGTSAKCPACGERLTRGYAADHEFCGQCGYARCGENFIDPNQETE